MTDPYNEMPLSMLVAEAEKEAATDGCDGWCDIHEESAPLGCRSCACEHAIQEAKDTLRAALRQPVGLVDKRWFHESRTSK